MIVTKNLNQSSQFKPHTVKSLKDFPLFQSAKIMELSKVRSNLVLRLTRTKASKYPVRIRRTRVKLIFIASFSTILNKTLKMILIKTKKRKKMTTLTIICTLNKSQSSNPQLQVVKAAQSYYLK